MKIKPRHKVGYKKPPRATQFKPGQSGNPKGRPKGSQNFESIFEQELDIRIPVTENGTRKTITKRQAVGKQVVNKAAAGDTKATLLLLKTVGETGGQSDNPDAPDFVPGREDQFVMADIVKRIRSMRDVSEDPGDVAPESALPLSLPDPEPEDLP